MGDLDGGHADASGAGVHQDAIAAAHARDIAQRVPSRHENDRQGGGLLKGETLRDALQIATAGDGFRGQTEDG